MNDTATPETYRRIAACVHRIGRRVMIDAPRMDAALCGRDIDPDARPMLITVTQLVDRHPGLTGPAVRQLIARAERVVAGGGAE